MSIRRTNQIILKLDDQEMELLQKRMELAGIRNRSAFLRKMAFNGHIINLDWHGLNEMLRLEARTSANVNQIAIRCHETDNLYAEDMKELKDGYDTLTEQMKKMAEDVSTLKGCY